MTIDNYRSWKQKTIQILKPQMMIGYRAILDLMAILQIARTSKREEERQAVLDFAKYFVVEVFEKSFASDRARLAGRQLNLIRDTCEFLYRLEDDRENITRQSQLDDLNNETDEIEDEDDELRE